MLGKSGKAMGEKARDEPLRSWFSDWGNVLIAALVIYVAGYIVWLIAELGPASNRVAITELAFLPVMLIGAVLAWRVSRLSKLPEQTRLAWKVFAVGYVVWLAGDALWARSAISSGQAQFPSLADAAYLLAPLILIAGILLFPTDPEPGKGRIRHQLDFAIILIGMTALTSYFIIGPELMRFTAEPSLEAVLITGYSVTNTLVVLAVFSALLLRPQSGTVGVMILVGLGLTLYSVADLWWAYQEIRGAYVTDAVMYGLWITAQLLLVIAPQRHFDVISRNLERPAPGRYAELLQVALPYSAAAVVAVVITVAALPELIDRFGLVVILMVALLVLFVLRQLLTLRENARLRVEQVKQESEARFRALVEYSSDLISVVDRDLSCQFQSPSIVDLTGQDSQEFLGKHILNWVHPNDRVRVEQILNDVVAGHIDRVRFDWRLQLPDTGIVFLETIVSNELDNPVVKGLVLNSRDVSERRELESKLNYQAYHDNLTGLLNRAGFLRAMDYSVDDLEPGEGLGLLFIDLDRFKPINDTLGHKAGDEVLVIVAERLQDSVRPGDVLGRIGGDEFTVMLPTIAGERDAVRVAERILDALHKPMRVAEQDVSISSSIGIAIASSNRIDHNALLREADSAMYAAKRNGRGRAAVFEPWMNEDLLTLTRPRINTSP
jgi:diguanylate cyclase (GGDEF)-like protein/PAS domain S-box-containing protein